MTSTFQSRGSSGGGRRPGGGGRGKGKSRGGARTVALRRNAPPVERTPVALPSVLTVAELGEKLHATGVEIIGELMEKFPMFGEMPEGFQFDEAALGRIVAMVDSMTPGERARPDACGSRRCRAQGRGPEG